MSEGTRAPPAAEAAAPGSRSQQDARGGPRALVENRMRGDVKDGRTLGERRFEGRESRFVTCEDPTGPVLAHDRFQLSADSTQGSLRGKVLDTHGQEARATAEFRSGPQEEGRRGQVGDRGRFDQTGAADLEELERQITKAPIAGDQEIGCCPPDRARQTAEGDPRVAAPFPGRRRPPGPAPRRAA